MTTAEETEDPVINATLLNNEARQASKQVAFMLVMICRAAEVWSRQDQEKGSWRGVRCAAALNHVSRLAWRVCC